MSSKKELDNMILRCNNRIDSEHKFYEDKFKNYERRFFNLQQELWKLQNPFKFKLGDTVRRIVPITFNGHIDLDTPLQKESNEIYKIISCDFRLMQFEYQYSSYNYRTYDIFCCDTNEKYTASEGELVLVKEKKK